MNFLKMAKFRSINTRIWHDNWIREKLNPLDRYLFIYLLTNEHSNLSGLYELPLSTIAFETGLDENDLKNSLLPRLEPKVFYRNGWVFVKNFTKHHQGGGPKLEKGVEIAKSEIPSDILKEFDKISIEYRYPMDTPTPSASASASASASSPEGSPLKSGEGPDDIKYELDYDLMTPAQRKAADKAESGKQKGIIPREVLNDLIKWGEDKAGKRFPNRIMQETSIKRVMNAGYTAEAIKECWEELENDEFWSEKGIHFGTILSQIGKAKGKKMVEVPVKKYCGKCKEGFILKNNMAYRCECNPELQVSPFAKELAHKLK